MNALIGVRANPMGTRTIRSTRAREVSAAPATSTTATTTTSPAKALSAAAAGSTASAAKAQDTSETSTSTTRAVDKELDRDAFLQLLVFQMQNQDPLSPTDNTQMISQLAQFSSLEQMNNLNQSFQTLHNEIDQLGFVSASQMIGRTVTGTDATGAAQAGKVESVFLDSTSGGIYLVVNGQQVPLANVQRVE